MTLTLRTWLAAASASLALLGCEARSRQSAEALREVPEQTTQRRLDTASSNVTPLDVAKAFEAVDRIGAKRRIHFGPATGQEAHSPPDAWKLEFEKDAGFGGVCWKNRAGNEGEAPGDDLSKPGYRRLTFWARGAKGGEIAEFRAGGLGNVKTRYADSFDVSLGKVKLDSTWKELTIYVMDADLSSVMTAFCALFHQEDNPDGAVIFLDGIQYRG